MAGTMQSTFSRKRSSVSSSDTQLANLRSPQIRVDQVLEGLNVIAQQIDSTTQVLSTGLVDETFFVSSPDGRRTYSASRSSSTLVGYYNSPGEQPEEFCRVRLGLSSGGISAVAVGGTWVFAACGEADRVVVLRLCHDWYQNRTRLLVMRIVDGGLNPTRVVTSKHGSIVCVLYSGENLVRVYRCLHNGKLDVTMTIPVDANCRAIEMDESSMTLRIFSACGHQTVELESIFEETEDLAMVRR